MQLEVSIEETVVRKAYRLGAYGIKVKSPTETALPDRLFVIKGGRQLFIEFKKPGEKPTKKQLWMHALLRRLGADVEVHDTVKGAMEAIRRRLDGKSKA